MKVLVTGAKGFVGRNLVARLKNIQSGRECHALNKYKLEIFEYDLDTDPSLLEQYCKEADFIFNLAGVNRPDNVSEYISGNLGFSITLIELLKKYGNTCPVMLSSSIQAVLDNPYGKSKQASESIFFSYAQESGSKVLVYRFPNLFGKWCRPNYNSVVATFCNNIANNLPITVNDPTAEMTLVYIDDVIEELIGALTNNEHKDGMFCTVPVNYHVSLGEIVELIYTFKNSQNTGSVPNVGDAFTKKLYSTYLSYLPEKDFIYSLKMNRDERGSFTEIIHTPEGGQFSVNISKPGIIKGQHWHNTKHEKFVVVSGYGLIQLRKIGKDNNGNLHPIINFKVSGEALKVVEMIPGYTHNIINLSDHEDLVTFIWANEKFNPEKPDTFFEVVEERAENV